MTAPLRARYPGHDSDPLRRPPYYQDQIRGFVGEGLPREARIWSKAGHTCETRHDMIYFELPSGAGCVAAIYTVGSHMALNERFLPAFGRKLMRMMEAR